MKSNVNPTFSDLMKKHVFNEGFYFHDIDAAGFCIRQKLAPLRHALFFKHLKLDVVEEYIPEIEEGTVSIWKHRVIDLKQEQFQDIDLAVKLVTEWRGSGSANSYVVFQSALQILKDRQWIERVQSVALELQFQIRPLSGLKRVYPQWPFHEEYKEWIRSAFPMVEDLTAQSLYWECIRLLCLNERNLMPQIHKLFDGPLFHFFCYLQRSGDPKRFIQEMMSALETMHSDRRANATGHRFRGRGSRGRGLRRNLNGPPICSFYDGRDVSCRNGIHCRFQHIQPRFASHADSRGRMGDRAFRRSFQELPGGRGRGQRGRGSGRPRMHGHGARGKGL